MAHLLKTRVKTPVGAAGTSSTIPAFEVGFPRHPGMASAKTTEEALSDLDAVFSGLDILGEGKLDEAAFKVAILSLGVSLPDSEIEAIFEQLDRDETGFIEYKEFLSFMRMGKIPSALLNRVKKSAAAPRKSIFFGGGAMAVGIAVGAKAKVSHTGTTSLLPVAELDRLRREREMMEDSDSDSESLSASQLRRVNRALLVIKKAILKKLPRDDVEKFLMAKGMDEDEIDVAWHRAKKLALSPAERVKALKGDVLKKERALDEQKDINAHLTRKMTEQSRDVEMLRDLLAHCVDLLEDHYEQTFDDPMSTDAAQEINAKLAQLKLSLDTAESDASREVIQSDLSSLEQCAKLMGTQRYFHAFLAFSCLPESHRSGLPITTDFLEKYGPEEDS